MHHPGLLFGWEDPYLRELEKKLFPPSAERVEAAERSDKCVFDQEEYKFALTSHLSHVVGKSKRTAKRYLEVFKPENTKDQSDKMASADLAEMI